MLQIISNPYLTIELYSGVLYYLIRDQYNVTISYGDGEIICDPSMLLYRTYDIIFSIFVV